MSLQSCKSELEIAFPSFNHLVRFLNSLTPSITVFPPFPQKEQVDCEIELLGMKLTGKEGARKWLNWLYSHANEIELVPVTIMVDGDTFFEEFIAEAKLHNGVVIRSKQAEVLLYENYKVKNLRLYFDRLDFADSVTKGFIGKAIVRQLIKTSLKGLK